MENADKNNKEENGDVTLSFTKEETNKLIESLNQRYQFFGSMCRGSMGHNFYQSEKDIHTLINKVREQVGEKPMDDYFMPTLDRMKKVDVKIDDDYIRRINSPFNQD